MIKKILKKLLKPALKKLVKEEKVKSLKNLSFNSDGYFMIK